MASNFTDLAAYQRAVALAADVLRTARERGLLDWDARERIAAIARPLNGLINKPTSD